MNRAAALTDAIIEALPFADSGQYVVRDLTLSGFFVVVGTRSKTFTIQVATNGSTGTRSSRRKSVGRFGALTTRRARTLAKNMVGELAATQAEAPQPQKITLGTAWRGMSSSLWNIKDQNVPSKATGITLSIISVTGMIFHSLN
jgi:hypothetical protein